MINLILTRECAKRCSFCFTGDYTKETEISLDFVDRLFNQFSDIDSVNILGGEPTQHPKFTQIIDKVAIEYNTQYMLISNLLFPKRILEWIVKNRINRTGILANGMELTTKDSRFKLYKKNWNTIYNESNGEDICIAITIAKNHSPEYFKEYFKILKNELAGIPTIRIGLDLSNTDIINNTMYGDSIRAIQEELPVSSIIFDCQIPPCIFNYDLNKVLHNYSNMDYLCNNVALDIFYDSSAIFGYCVQNIRTEDIFDYDSTNELKLEFRRQYKEQERETLYKEISDVCKSCGYYSDNTCNSLCMGCHSGKQGAERATLPTLPSKPL
tara:strand:- start:958 stop:1935 length:978 start_codon:yes stop_codon:yes gene_type:complete